MTGVLEIAGSFTFVLFSKISVGIYQDMPAWKSFLVGTGLPSPPGLWGRASQGPDTRCLSSAGSAVCGGTGSWQPDPLDKFPSPLSPFPPLGPASGRTDRHTGASCRTLAQPGGGAGREKRWLPAVH